MSVEVPTEQSLHLAAHRAHRTLAVMLSALEPRDYRELALHFERVQLGHGDVLLEPGAEIRHVWFPEDCVISLTVLMREGGSSEAATIGREGVVGLVSALGSRQ